MADFIQQGPFKGTRALASGVSSLGPSVQTSDLVGDIMHSNYIIVEGRLKRLREGSPVERTEGRVNDCE